VHQIVQALYELKIQSVLIEGGAALLQSFIDEGYWDEARVITNAALHVPAGLAAPALSGASLAGSEKMMSDRIDHYVRTGNILHDR
jgi:diaminohydroxyphosphoribosylaminopyrimidine deaminase/5-amino-6-(5-phosphoribosylamino)uracil reductase